MAKKASRNRIPLFSNQPQPEPIEDKDSIWHFPDVRIAESDLSMIPVQRNSDKNHQKSPGQPIVSVDQNIPPSNTAPQKNYTQGSKKVKVMPFPNDLLC